jgi:hypothetical protein
MLTAKYYVISGALNVAILGSGPRDAAIRAISNFSDKVLGSVVLVNQHGYGGTVDTGDQMYQTNELLTELGMY